MRILAWILLFISILHGIEVDNNTTYNEILSDSFYYIDYNHSATIDNIGSKNFKPINSKVIGFGYSPDFVVWIKFVLTNKSSKKITKIVEYASPLTSYVDFYDAKSKKLLKSSGMLNKNSNESINPILKVTLKPHESKTFYIKISSHITSLLAKLNLWNPKEYTLQQKRNQIVLALFFGAMGIIIIYNSIISIMVKKIIFFYYALAFSGILIYYLLYLGIMPLFVSKEWMHFFNNYIPFIALIPLIFLSLFTKKALSLEKNRKINTAFMLILAIAVISTFLFYILNLHSIRNLSYVILFFMLLGLSVYYFNKSSYAKYLFFSWIIFFLVALFMYLEKIQVFDLSYYYPYYSEIALLFETLSFSLILSHYIQKLELNKKEIQKEIQYKELIINELDHRISGMLQSFIFRIEQEEKKKDISLKSLKQNLFAIAEINRHLNTTQSFPNVNIQEYFSAIIKKMNQIYNCPNIKIKVVSNAILKPKSAQTCAKILNEALTNIYKYAFDDKKGKVLVSLIKNKTGYKFIISDNGKGFKRKREGGIGLDLIKDFAIKELKGIIKISSNNGTKIIIKWS